MGDVRGKFVWPEARANLSQEEAKKLSIIIIIDPPLPRGTEKVEKWAFSMETIDQCTSSFLNFLL